LTASIYVVVAYLAVVSTGDGYIRWL